MSSRGSVSGRQEVRVREGEVRTEAEVGAVWGRKPRNVAPLEAGKGRESSPGASRGTSPAIP